MKQVTYWLNHLLLWLVFMPIVTVACQPDPPPALPVVTATEAQPPLLIGLSDGAVRIGDLAGEGYQMANGRAIPQFITGNDQILLADLKDGFLDAALVYHVPDDESYWFNPVALDGLILIVNPDNSITDLSLTEVQAIFGGLISDWSMITGAEQPIQLISREQGAGSRLALENRIMAGQPIPGSTLIAPSDEAMWSAVSDDQGALGYGMMGNAVDVKTLSINNVQATPKNTAEQLYPLTLPLYFVSIEEPLGELRAFLAWLQSADGQAIIGENYGRVR